MLLKESAVAHHLRSTLFRYYGKLIENNSVCLNGGQNADEGLCECERWGGILPTLSSHLRSTSLSESGFIGLTDCRIMVDKTDKADVK